MKIHGRLSIQLELTILCVLIALLSLGSFATVVFVRSSVVVKQLAERNNNQVISSAANYLHTRIDDINADMISFQAKENVQAVLSGKSKTDTAADIAALENAILEIDPFQIHIQYSELYVLGRDDFPSLGNSHSIFSDAQLKNDIWYNSVLTSETSANWQIHDSVAGQSFIVVSRLIYDIYTKKPVAILKSNINLREITSYLDDITLAETGKIFLCSGSHIVNKTGSPLGSKLANNSIVFNEMFKSGEKQTKTIMIDNAAWLVQSAPIDNTGMFLLSAVKIDEFSSAHSAITSAIIITAVIIVLLAIVLSYFISLLITKPIHLLSNQMNNYNIEQNVLLPTSSKNEVGILVESFKEMDKQIHTLIENINRETEIRKIAELKALQAQITPHFLYNTLNSISLLAKSCGAKKIEKMIIALSRFFMHSLNNGGEMISIGNELEQVMSYVYLQKIRYGDKFAVNVQTDTELKSYLICKLTLQPLVENCICHAFSDIDYQGVINIRIVKEDEYIIITVSDNGIGNITIDFKEINEYVNKDFDLSEPIEKYGINNVAQRIRLYFGDDCGLEYMPNKDEGITVKIRIKAIEENEINT